MVAAQKFGTESSTSASLTSGRPRRRELHGWRIGVTADRRAQQQIRLLEQRGASTMWGPVLRTIDLSEAGELFAVTDELIAHPPELLVLQTGQGVSWWFDALERTGRGVATLRSALTTTEVVCRGAKATSAARRLGLDVRWQAPNEVASEVVEHLASRGVGGDRVALQLDGGETSALEDRLRGLGAVILPVPVYRWARPHDLDPARRLVGAVVGGEVDAVTFTASPAVHALTQLARELGLEAAMHECFVAGRLPAVCVGPVCASAATELGWQNVLQPRDRPRLVSMIDELTRYATTA